MWTREIQLALNDRSLPCWRIMGQTSLTLLIYKMGELMSNPHQPHRDWKSSHRQSMQPMAQHHREPHVGAVVAQSAGVGVGMVRNVCVLWPPVSKVT